MFEAIIFVIISIAIIMGGAMVLLNTAKKPKIPKNIKSPEEIDKENDDYKNS